MSLGDGTASTPDHGTAPTGSLGLSSPTTTTAPPADVALGQVQDVLSSEVGITAMLNRLKQSIASAKEFAGFLKKRSFLEEEHSNGLKKLCRQSQESSQRAEHRGGSFAKAYEEMMAIHERMAENGSQFSMSLHQMQEDLLELAAIAEKSRKGWKQNGLVAEQRVAELEAAMRKSKSKYDALAEEYDRARTGDTSSRPGGKMFGFKGPKSAAQHEEDLLRKAQAADQDYQGRVHAVQTERGELLARTRPETVKALHDIVKECDSGVVLQMQKFASFNEKLLLSNGLSISPLKSSPEARSLRECILAINNDKDLHDYLTAHYSRVPAKAGEPKYERNPLLDPAHRVQPSPFSQMQPIQGPAPVQPPPSQPQLFNSMTSRSSTFADSPISSPNQGPMGHQYGQSTSSIPPIGATQRPSSQPQHERTFSHGSAVGGPTGSQYGALRGPGPGSQQNSMPSSRFNGGGYSSPSSQGPPQLGALAFQPSQSSQPSQPQHAQHAQQLPYGQPPPQHGAQSSNPLQQNPPTPSGLPMGPAQGLRQSPPAAPQMAPSRPVFGLSLSRLYERDNLAVPMVVHQCIQAVDLFGLGVEGIYRLSGSVPHVNKLKTLFDTDSGSSNLDFRNPENFFHDVNSVAGLLKQFFRDLPDPLLTHQHYANLIESAKHEDEILRRDSLHAIINALPDPNYATLRALALHLHRVVEMSSKNRMSVQNLAIVFGPTLMGTAPGSNISDAGWQVRVVETILQNTYQIFDDDE